MLLTLMSWPPPAHDRNESHRQKSGEEKRAGGEQTIRVSF